MDLNEIYYIDVPYLLQLKDNWDDDGSKKPNQNDLYNAINFLIEISDLTECVPSINSCSDGTIDLEFHVASNYHFLLLINFDGYNYSYFGQTKENDNNEINKLRKLRLNICYKI